MSVRIDHVIYAVEDLDVAGNRFRGDFGLGSIAGGRHPHWGTANRIVPLGRDYVELVTVVDRDAAAASDFGRPVLDAIAKRQPLVGWAAQTDDLQGIANRLGLQVEHGSRTRPDGSVLAWQLAGVAQGLAGGALPFFIEWDVPPELHPGAANAHHEVSPVGIASIEITGDKQSLHQWLGDTQLPLRIIEGRRPFPQWRSALPPVTSCCGSGIARTIESQSSRVHPRNRRPRRRCRLDSHPPSPLVHPGPAIRDIPATLAHWSGICCTRETSFAGARRHEAQRQRDRIRIAAKGLQKLDRALAAGRARP